MTRDGPVRRLDLRTVPHHVEYELEAFGIDLGRPLQPGCEWGGQNMNTIALIARGRKDNGQ